MASCSRGSPLKTALGASEVVLSPATLERIDRCVARPAGPSERLPMPDRR